MTSKCTRCGNLEVRFNRVVLTKHGDIDNKYLCADCLIDFFVRLYQIKGHKIAKMLDRFLDDRPICKDVKK